MAQRVLVHISRSEQRVIDPDDVYCLVANGGETEVRLRGRTPLVDIRPLGELLPSFDLAYADTLWKSADALRGQVDAAEYKHVVLGLLFLKYISDAFQARREELERPS
jgi:hypothetical protein